MLISAGDPGLREAYVAILARSGHELQIDTAENLDETLAKVASSDYDVLLSDLGASLESGRELLQDVKRVQPSLMVMLLGEHPTVDDVLGAFRDGAFDCAEKPLPPGQLIEMTSRALEARRLGGQRRKLARDLESQKVQVRELQRRLSRRGAFAGIVGRSPAILRVIETVQAVAETESTVLLTGESGTGKGLVARTVHEASKRAGGPFVEANCVAYSEGVLHSELFGHERGAFTGAARAKRGRFELALGGTLFLDEIGEISPATQLLLLRILEDRKFERVGGEQTLDADVRLIAATNRDLQEALRQGVFRNDLFYRLNVIPIALPSLRERAEDVPLLAQHFLARSSRRLGYPPKGISDDALEALVQHPWPGNVRELVNVIERVVVLNRSDVVELCDLPASIRAAPAVRQGRGTLQSMERLRIIEALREASGNKKQAARTLGIHRSTLYAKLRRHGLLDPAPPEEAECRESQHEPSEAATLVTSSSKS